MRNIKSYTQFINELKTVNTYVSNSGKTRIIDSIYDLPKSSKSLSSGILLKDELKKIEFEEFLKKIEAELDKEQIDFIVNNDKTEKVLLLLNNLRFLKSELKREGELSCEYCGKEDLKIYDISKGDITPESLSDPNILINTKFNPKDGATCDHKIPKSKGGDKFNFSNLAVSCYSCNRRKGNMSWEKWQNLIKRK
jgi:hypothetical protein